MKLYQYDHCPFCIRVKMLLGRKQMPYETITIPYDEVDTPTQLIGKKMLPILIKEDGSAMAESLDILAYLDHLDEKAILSNKKLPDNLAQALSSMRSSAGKLYKPRIIQTDINDFSTEGAIAYYEQKFIKRHELSFAEILQQSNDLLPEVQQGLDQINERLPSEANIFGEVFSMADIHLFPSLRNLTVVKALRFPPRLNNYLHYQAEQANLALFFDQAI